MNRAHQQAPAEPAGAGKEIITSAADETIYKFGLVDIQIIALPELLEVLDADGQVAECGLCFHNTQR